jgi:sialate O-acetylesterase
MPKEAMKPRQVGATQHFPGYLFNAMVNPLIPYGIRGAIWYQGESNAGRAYQYRTLQPALIKDWRQRWRQGKFPFLIVPLANFRAPAENPRDDSWAELREAQSLTVKTVANTAQAVIIDIGEAKDIHPKNKQDVGRRLSLAARSLAYKQKLVYSGPVYKSMKVKGDKIYLKFRHLGDGLMAKGGELQQFAIAGVDRRFVWAQARIEGKRVVVWSPEGAKPVAVRYAWNINPEGCNLYNRNGLPASPFRTDSWPGMTTNAR